MNIAADCFYFFPFLIKVNKKVSIVISENLNEFQFFFFVYIYKGNMFGKKIDQTFNHLNL